MTDRTNFQNSPWWANVKSAMGEYSACLSVEDQALVMIRLMELAYTKGCVDTHNKYPIPEDMGR